MRVNFTPGARDDLIAIHEWIAEHNERSAERVVSRIVQTALMFGDFPLLGRDLAGAVLELPWRIGEHRPEPLAARRRGSRCGIGVGWRRRI